jgi:ABC-2 type transport system ATP-binding protein
MSAAVPAIRTSGLRKLYDGKAAVDGLDLIVPAGSFFGFLGPNGAGKTTTIRMLAGLASPSSGEIRLLGRPLDAEVKRHVGVVPDQSLLFDHLTGPEFLEFAGRLYGLDRGVARERARELVELFELDGSWGKLIADYSKGMRKRLEMAAALIHRPRLFLLDEPFEGVDAVGARVMKKLLEEQVRAGATVFLTSHVLEVVERLCDRVAVIHQGRLVLEGEMAELAAGSRTLEDVFVSVVGLERAAAAPRWLNE